ncbi:MAG TPA: glycosyl transferase family 4 [Candidatus Saccharimonadia bacterium]|nr:glycosyl transferase family 4 [Candidatus Saccharimonadia bacterium]
MLHPVAIAAAALLSASVIVASISYARRRRLLDAPGARRSHVAPTPRGGGIGPVLAVLALGFAPLVLAGASSFAAAAHAFALVAAIGWLDDHRPIAAMPRLCVHVLAAGLVAFAWPESTVALSWPLVALAVAALAWSINLHNFMDGIDGLLAMQGAFVLAVLAFALVASGDDASAHVAAVAAAALLAFLPFNAPRARVFMGDVGSGAIGLLVGAASLWAYASGALDLPQLLVLSSAFTIDATATLVSRIVRGRRFLESHREHLYQWLARRSRSHARVTLLYLAWNLVLVLPLLALTYRTSHAGTGSVYSWSVAAAVHAFGLALWITGKRKLVRRP